MTRQRNRRRVRCYRYLRRQQEHGYTVTWTMTIRVNGMSPSAFRVRVWALDKSPE